MLNIVVVPSYYGSFGQMRVLGLLATGSRPIIRYPENKKSMTLLG
jgi:hypothetical protein